MQPGFTQKSGNISGDSGGWVIEPDPGIQFGMGFEARHHGKNCLVVSTSDNLESSREHHTVFRDGTSTHLKSTANSRRTHSHNTTISHKFTTSGGSQTLNCGVMVQNPSHHIYPPKQVLLKDDARTSHFIRHNGGAW